MINKKRNNLRLLVRALALTCLVFSYIAFPQDTADKPMESKALAALVEELRGVVSRTAPVKNEAKQVGEKWDKREDLAGKTRKAVIDLLYADVESVIKDSGTRYSIFSIFSSYKVIGDTPPNKPEPLPVDEFQWGNCESLLARMDAFILELQNRPDSKGYVVTNGKQYPRITAERAIKNVVHNKGLEPGRIAYADGGGTGDKAIISFWLVPPGANAPETSPGSNRDLIIPAETKPFIFGQEFAGGLGGCSEYDPEFFAEAMNANPASRGNIVIYETSRRKFRETEKEILSMLTGSSITRKRLRTFYVRVKPGSYREGIELWLLP